MSIENFDEKIHIRNRTSVKDFVVKNILKEHLEEIADAHRDTSVSINEILGSECSENFRQLFHIIREKLKNRDIDKPSFSKLFFQKINADDVGKLGFSAPLYVNIYDRNIKDFSLKQLSMFRTIIHESYHSIARYKFVLSENKDIDGHITGLDIRSESSGASFTPEGSILNEHGNLLEEGSAVQFENEIFEEAKKLFPKEKIQLYENFINESKKQLELQKKKFQINVFKEMRKLLPDTAKNALDKAEEEIKLTDNEKERLFATLDIESYNDSGEVTFSSNEAYEFSMQVSNYLKQIIPDYLILLEKARVQGKILPLARAIDGTLGVGWYRRISTAKTDEASNILTELKSIKLEKL